MESKADVSIEKIAEQIDQLLGEFKNESEEIKEKVKRLIELIEEFNRIGLIKIVKKLKEDEKGKKLLLELVKEPEVYALFLKHRIVKPDKRSQVAMLIEKIKPYIRSHGGDIELVDIQGDTLIVKMFGSCVGCSQVGETLQKGILEVVQEQFPDIKNIRVIPVRSSSPVGEEKKVVPLEELSEGRLYHYKDEDIDVIIVQHNGNIYAYYNACPHQGLGLEGGSLNGEILTCPWHGFQYLITTGECITANYLQLEPVEISVKDGWVWVRV